MDKAKLPNINVGDWVYGLQEDILGLFRDSKMDKAKQPNMDVGDWVYGLQEPILGLTLEPTVFKRAKVKAGRPQEADTTAAGSR